MVSLLLTAGSGTEFDAVRQVQLSGLAPVGRPAEIPLPGAMLLMGSVLIGGAGLAKWRRRESRMAA
jgi:hypothetical protein